MQVAKSKNAAQCALAAPTARRRQGHEASDAVLMVVDEEAQRAREVVFDKFSEAGFAVYKAIGGAYDIVGIGEETSVVSWGIRNHVEDVPDVCSDVQRGPLEG